MEIILTTTSHPTTQKMKNVLTMKKNLFLILIFSCNFLVFNCFAQEYLWTIKRDNTSEGIISVKSKELDILYRPDEYIDKEHNFATLFLTAPEGTTIVSPVDGTIIFCNYGYFNNIYSVSNFGNYSGDFEQDKKNILEYIASGRHPIKKMDIRYLSLGIYLQTDDGRKVAISGLYPVKQFKSGEKIKKGDVIGTMGYSYKAINIVQDVKSHIERTPSDQYANGVAI